MKTNIRKWSANQSIAKSKMTIKKKAYKDIEFVGDLSKGLLNAYKRKMINKATFNDEVNIENVSHLVEDITYRKQMYFLKMVKLNKNKYKIVEV